MELTWSEVHFGERERDSRDGRRRRSTLKEREGQTVDGVDLTRACVYDFRTPNGLT
jgi:hypothetical protein